MQLTLDLPQQTLLTKLLLEESKFRLSQRALATRAGYAHDWKMFEAWCHTAERSSLPTTIQTVSLFLTDQISTGRKISTAQRRLHGILSTLRERGYSLDGQAQQARAIISGAQRLRCEQPRQVAALTVAQVAEIASKLAKEGTPISLRNRSLITLGFASALRRSNLSALKLADITLCGGDGLLVRVTKEKQDQTGKGRVIPIPRGTGPACALAALESWLVIRGNAAGPLFTSFDPARRNTRATISPNAIWKILKCCVAKVGLDPRLYGAHSMRAGFVTEALSRGVGEIRVASHTGHRSLDCLRRYFRPRDPFASSACAAIGL